MVEDRGRSSSSYLKGEKKDEIVNIEINQNKRTMSLFTIRRGNRCKGRFDPLIL